MEHIVAGKYTSPSTSGGTMILMHTVLAGHLTALPEHYTMGPALGEAA